MYALAKAATMSPMYWWHVHRPKMRPRPFLGNQLPMMAVFTGPPVAWKKPWQNCVPANHTRDAVADAAMAGTEDPIAMSTRQMVDPRRPMPTTAVGLKRSPRGPVMKEPPAYVNMKAESMAASVYSDTPTPSSCTSDVGK